MFSAKYAGRKVSTEILLINNVSIHGDANYKVIRRMYLAYHNDKAYCWFKP